jgi:gluconolactonase
VADHTSFFIPCDAHEGCVWVPSQSRLYFSTTKKLDEPRAGISYLDFYGKTNFAALDREQVESMQPVEWIRDANMANSFCLSNDGQALLVCEQGDHDTPAAVTRIGLSDQNRTVLFDNYRGQPLNSPNKVKQSRQGHLIVSDPDYGFRQGFRPPPQLEPSIYVIPSTGEPTCFRCALQMPHGLALSPDEATLFITDTSNDGAHEEQGVELGRRCSVYAFSFRADTGEITDNPRYAFRVDEGVPDGSITTSNRLLVGGGDGVYVADLRGNLLGKIPTEHTAVNLCVVGDDLFITADKGVYLLLDWQSNLQTL